MHPHSIPTNFHKHFSPGARFWVDCGFLGCGVGVEWGSGTGTKIPPWKTQLLEWKVQEENTVGWGMSPLGKPGAVGSLFATMWVGFTV